MTFEIFALHNPLTQSSRGGLGGKRTTMFTQVVCSELVGCTRLYLQTVKFGLHFRLDCNLW